MVHHRINGASHLASIDTATGSVAVHPTPFTTITNLVRRGLLVKQRIPSLDVPHHPVCHAIP